MSTFILRDIAGREYPVGASAIIGREQTCQIVVDDPSVSRVHATIWEQQGVLYVRDENSRNGTFVGGIQIAPTQPTPLRAGDQLRVGNVAFSVTATPQPAAAGPTQPMSAPPTVPATFPAHMQPVSPPPTHVVTPVATAQSPKSKTPLILGCVALLFLGVIGFCVFGLGGLAILGSGYSTPIPITVQAIATTAPIVQQLPTAATISVPASPPPAVIPTIAPPTVAPPTVTPTIALPTAAPPTVTPTPTGTPTFGKITIAENVTDAGEIINPTNTFPAGTKTVHAYFTYLNMKNGDAWGRKWFRDGALLLEKNETWDGGATGWRSYNYFMTDGAALVSGTYDFVLYLGGKEVQRAAFVVGAMGGAPPPPSAPTTPLNACPPNPHYVRLGNGLNVDITINMSGPRTYRFVLPPGRARDLCFVPGTYSYTMSARGYQDNIATKTLSPNSSTPDCNWFYEGGITRKCSAPTDLRLYSPPDAAGALPSPDAINIFFTIENGSPTGYVIDKQGARYTPPGYLTISGFHVNVGDRIVIQTDQSRFSMLFDCGTTPQIYSPCDFMAAVPSNLPAEIRKMARGTAFLNISRADNWAGVRPNFPSQRYPADPILRIVLGD